MKSAIPTAVLIAYAGVSAAANDLIDTAQVVSSTPILERIAGSRQECDPVPAAAPQQCRSVPTTREVVKGYTVVYRYNGRDITTTLPYDPGPTVRVGVGVVEGPSAAGTPSAETMGSNVREVRRPARTADTPPQPAANPGGYQYRY